MRQFPLTKEVDLAQLEREINTATGRELNGILSASWDSKKGTLFIHRDDIDPALVQQVVDAHVPRPDRQEEAEGRLRQVPDSLLSTSPWGPIVRDLLRYLGLRE